MQDFSLVLYTEIDLLCLFLVFVTGSRSFTHIENRKSWQYFRRAQRLIQLFVASDLVCALMESGKLSAAMPVRYLVNAVYYLSLIGVAGTWFAYTEIEVEDTLYQNKAYRAAMTLPFFAMVALVLASFWSNAIFRIDEAGYFVRGDLNFFALVLPGVYLVLAGWRAVHSAFLPENYAYRRNYLNLAMFGVILIVTSLLQQFIVGTPLPCIGSAVAMLLVHFNEQVLLVSLDPLTKLNNRRQLERFLSQKMQHHEDDKLLYLYLIDMDNFKQINDTYGHIEGDAALLRMADVLKLTAAAFNCFVARYGGDEFIIIHEAPDEAEALTLRDFLNAKLAESNAASQTPYQLQVSVGMALHEPEIRYVPDLIARADKGLYHEKRRKHR